MWIWSDDDRDGDGRDVKWDISGLSANFGLILIECCRWFFAGSSVGSGQSLRQISLKDSVSWNRCRHHAPNGRLEGGWGLGRRSCLFQRVELIMEKGNWMFEDYLQPSGQASLCFEVEGEGGGGEGEGDGEGQNFIQYVCHQSSEK